MKNESSSMTTRESIEELFLEDLPEPDCPRRLACLNRLGIELVGIMCNDCRIMNMNLLIGSSSPSCPPEKIANCFYRDYAHLGFKCFKE
jgi:hypothetical protein